MLMEKSKRERVRGQRREGENRNESSRRCLEG